MQILLPISMLEMMLMLSSKMMLELTIYMLCNRGEVQSVEVMRDRNTGDPRGFAFVVFKADETVDLILRNKPHEINHKVVDVKRAQARGVAPPSIHGGNAGEEQNQPIVKHEENSNKNLSPEERHDKITVQRARKVEKFLSQPFDVAEVFTGSPGIQCDLDDILTSFMDVASGKADDLPEAAFYLTGGLAMVRAKAEKLAQ